LVRAAVLCLVNRQRALNGIAPLRASPRLASAAQRHSTDMARGRFFGHDGSAGDTFGDRIRASGYPQSGRGFTAGENIAWAAVRRSAPAAMVADWLASPEHRVNILDPGFRQTGIGLVLAPPSPFTGGGPGTAITEDFAALR
jgi:uncharacterized protein YkwD